MIHRHLVGARCAAPLAPRADESGESPQVLIGTDTREVRDLIMWLLLRGGYRAIATENGFSADMLLSAAHPTLIISNLNMQFGEGWEMFAFCNARHPEIPILLINDEALASHPSVANWARDFESRPLDSQRAKIRLARLLFPGTPPRSRPPRMATVPALA